MAEAALRKQVVATARRMNALGINHGASGNVSARSGRGFLITPSAMAYEAMSADDIVKIGPSGKAARRRTPSSEWRFHHDIYAARADAGELIRTGDFTEMLLARHDPEDGGREDGETTPVLTTRKKGIPKRRPKRERRRAGTLRGL